MNYKNRSVLFDFLNKKSPLKLTFTEIGNGRHPVFYAPWEWDTCYLLLNGMRFTGIQSIILFANEIVVNFMMYGDCKVNIPYKEIEFIEVREDMDVEYEKLYLEQEVKKQNESAN